MTTKAALIALLESNKDEFISGELAAEKLGVSRAAVWKAVESLRGQGLALESVPGRGYRLLPGSDLLSQEALRVFLNNPAVQLTVLEQVDSTNLLAKRQALEGAAHGTLVVAAAQTAGRGRLGRRFSSPPGGLYLSVVLRPERYKNETAVMITAAAAVCTCRAVAKLCKLELGIKWVNDLFFGTGKCCGILTEAGTDMETGSIDYMVVGIGINYTTRSELFPPEAAGIAVSLFPSGNPPVSRAQLAAAIYKELLEEFEKLEERKFLDEYRQRSVVLGREVQVLAATPYTAFAAAIDDDARLIVQTAKGEQQVISYGEISVRL